MDPCCKNLRRLASIGKLRNRKGTFSVQSDLPRVYLVLVAAVKATYRVDVWERRHTVSAVESVESASSQVWRRRRCPSLLPQIQISVQISRPKRSVVAAGPRALFRWSCSLVNSAAGVGGVSRQSHHWQSSQIHRLASILILDTACKPHRDPHLCG